jgi:hypothetical protein
MHDAIEAELLAARTTTFDRDEAAWVDRYAMARACLEPTLDPTRAVSAARTAWARHGWAHPAVVAHLEHELGTLDAD